MSQLNLEAWNMSLTTGIGYEQALGIMHGMPHVVVDQMRDANAPNHGNFWAHNMTSSRSALLFEEEPAEKTKYVPRSTNASQDKGKEALARKKEREKATEIIELKSANAKLHEKVAELTKDLDAVKLESPCREEVPMRSVDFAPKGKTFEYYATRVMELEMEKAETHKEREEEVKFFLEAPIEMAIKAEIKEEETEEYVEAKVPRFKMERSARLPVKPIYAVIKEKYPDIEELAKFVVQSYATGTAESPGSMKDQDSMTPDGEKSGRGYITSKYGDDCHPPLVKYMAFIQSQFEPFMHVRECGQFGSGFSVVMTGWPKETPKNMMQDDKKFGLVKTIGHRTKTHVDYDAGRGTSYSVCTAFQDDAFGILANSTGEETIVKLAKGESIIFSSSTFHFGCNHEDYNKAYKIKYDDWSFNDHGALVSCPRYRAFVYLDHYSARGKEQQILDSTGETTIYQEGIVDHHYKPQSLITDTFEEAAEWLADEMHDGWLWPCAELVNSLQSKGHTNDKGTVKKWDAETKNATTNRKRVRRDNY